MPGKKYIVELSSEEREELETLVNKGKAAAYKRKHAEILLKADQGKQGPVTTKLQKRQDFKTTVKISEILN